MTQNTEKEKKSDKALRVIISGGGTGGHIFPALSIAEALKRRLPDTEILFVGAEGRMEMERVPKAGYEIIGLPVAGFDRKRLWRNFSVFLKLWKSMRRAKKLVRDFRPDIAVGVGGYASGPTLKAAQKKGVPTLLQEQNSYAGVTNKLLGKNARRICVAYQEAERFFPAEKVVLTGNPVRAALLENTMTREEAKKALGFDPSKPLLLVVGGSLGAGTVNRAMGAGVKKLSDAGISVLWQTGKAYTDPEQTAAANRLKDVKAVTFIDNMDVAYKAADLVVSRAGAGSISELQLLGKPVVLVPSPNVAEDHQRKNAQALVNHGAAVMILDADAQAQLVDTALDLIKSPEKLSALSENILKMALPNAADKIVDNILEITGK